MAISQINVVAVLSQSNEEHFHACRIRFQGSGAFLVYLPHHHQSTTAARAAQRVPTGTCPQHTAANGTRATRLLQRLRAEM